MRVELWNSEQILSQTNKCRNLILEQRKQHFFCLTMACIQILIFSLVPNIRRRMEIFLSSTNSALSHTSSSLSLSLSHTQSHTFSLFLSLSFTPSISGFLYFYKAPSGWLHWAFATARRNSVLKFVFFVTKKNILCEKILNFGF